MNGQYILNGRAAVPAADLITWGRWLEKADRKVAVDFVGADDDENQVRISTVFLGLDHSFGEGPPLLFETMVFGGALDGEQGRYTTWEEAEAGHRKMVGRVSAALSADQGASR